MSVREDNLSRAVEELSDIAEDIRDICRKYNMKHEDTYKIIDLMYKYTIGHKNVC